MMQTLKSGLTIGMLVTALAMTGGCGDNDNSGNGNDRGVHHFCWKERGWGGNVKTSKQGGRGSGPRRVRQAQASEVSS